MKNIIFPVCADLLKIEDDTVCRGILNEFVPWFLDIFATGMNLDSGIVCGNLGIQNSFIFFTFFNLKTNFIIKKKKDIVIKSQFLLFGILYFLNQSHLMFLHMYSNKKQPNNSKISSIFFFSGNSRTKLLHSSSFRYPL